MIRQILYESTTILKYQHFVNMKMVVIVGAFNIMWKQYCYTIHSFDEIYHQRIYYFIILFIN